MLWAISILYIVTYISLVGEESETITCIVSAATSCHIIVIELTCIFPAFCGLLAVCILVSCLVKLSISCHSHIMILALTVFPLSLLPLSRTTVDDADGISYQVDGFHWNNSVHRFSDIEIDSELRIVVIIHVGIECLAAVHDAGFYFLTFVILDFIHVGRGYFYASLQWDGIFSCLYLWANNIVPLIIYNFVFICFSTIPVFRASPIFTCFFQQWGRTDIKKHSIAFVGWLVEYAFIDNVTRITYRTVKLFCPFHFVLSLWIIRRPIIINI